MHCCRCFSFCLFSFYELQSDYRSLNRLYHRTNHRLFIKIPKTMSTVKKVPWKIQKMRSVFQSTIKNTGTTKNTLFSRYREKYKKVPWEIHFSHLTCLWDWYSIEDCEKMKTLCKCRRIYVLLYTLNFNISNGALT